MAIAATIAASVLATAAATLVGRTVPAEEIWLGAAVTLGAFGIVYIAAAALLGHPDARRLVSRSGRQSA